MRWKRPPKSSHEDLPESFQAMSQEWDARRRASTRAFWRRRLKWTAFMVAFFGTFIPCVWYAAILFSRIGSVLFGERTELWSGILGMGVAFFGHYRICKRIEPWVEQWLER